MKFSESDFPLFLMIEDRKKFFLPMHRAAVLLSSWFTKVDIDGQVLDADFRIRKITDDEHRKMLQINDDYEASR